MSKKTKEDPFAKHYIEQLVGRKIESIVQDSEDEFNEHVYGLKLDNGCIAWILCDPEGNGPGFLQVQ